MFIIEIFQWLCLMNFFVLSLCFGRNGSTAFFFFGEGLIYTSKGSCIFSRRITLVISPNASRYSSDKKRIIYPFRRQICLSYNILAQLFVIKMEIVVL